MTLGSWMEKWYTIYCRPGIRESTATAYEACIYTHIIPKIGGWKLEEITTGKLAEKIAEIKEKIKASKQSGITMI